MTLKLLILLGTLTSEMAVGGEFINLDFNSPRQIQLETDPIFGTLYGPAADLIPGWTLTLEGSLIVNAGYLPVDEASTGFPVSLAEVNSFGRPVYGPFDLSIDWDKRISLKQEGIVPLDAQYLLFSSTQSNFPLVARVDGEAVPVLQTSWQLRINVSPFAGKQAELSFDFPAFGGGRFDIIGFESVPEPGLVGLLALGGLGLALVMRKRRAGEAGGSGK